MFDYLAGLNESAVFSLQENMRSGKMMQLKCLRAVAASRGGGMGHPDQGSAPTCPPVRRKNGQNQPFLAIFFNFCPLRNAFCSLDAPHKNFWCPTACMYCRDGYDVTSIFKEGQGLLPSPYGIEETYTTLLPTSSF